MWEELAGQVVYAYLKTLYFLIALTERIGQAVCRWLLSVARV